MITQLYRIAAAILHALAVALCRAGCVIGDAADAIDRRTRCHE